MVQLLGSAILSGKLCGVALVVEEPAIQSYISRCSARACTINASAAATSSRSTPQPRSMPN
ncbi:MAG: hypothetical protein U0Z44_22185 [Kouleothrix sp.]